MATQKQLSEKICDITECSICSESFKEPKVLPCIHTFCLHCLEIYGQEKEKDPGDEVDCPLCRQTFTIPQTGFNGLPNNYFIIQLLQVSLQQPSGGEAEKKDVQCELCSSVPQVSPASAYCIECGQHLCAMCIARHKVLKFAKMHKVVNLHEKPSAEELMKMMPSYCEQHPTDEIKFYCYDCNKTFCMVCYVDKHNTHKCSDVKKSAEEFRVQLDENLHILGTAKSQEELKELDEERSKFVTKVEATGKEIVERYNKLSIMLDKHQKELMEELRSYEAKCLKEIETRKDEVEIMFLAMESFKRYCTEMNDKGTPCEISRNAKDLHERTVELVKTEAELIGKKLPFAEIKLIPSTTSTANAKNWIGELAYKTEIQNNVSKPLPPSPVESTADMQNIYDCIPRTDEVFKFLHKDLDLTTELGAGDFGSVMQGIYKQRTGKVCRDVPVAVKWLKNASEDSELMVEAKLMAGLENKYIVRMIGVCRTSAEGIMLVFELVPLGPLHIFLEKNPLPMISVCRLMQQVAEGMAYLERKSFVHGDLAARNVLLASEDQVKISDCGMSKVLRRICEGEYEDEPDSSQHFKFPLKWLAPESIYYLKFDTKSDVWSYGVTLWEATSYGGKPYRGLKGQQIVEMIDHGGRMEKPDQCPDTVYDIMRLCWERKSEDRPSFKQIVQRMTSVISKI